MKTLLGLLALLSGCSKDNPYYCEGSPDDNCTLDSGTSGDAPKACESGDDCDGTLTACNTDTNVCVACTADDIGSCTGTKPVCSTMNTCRACAENADCASGACLPDGSCASAAALLFASPSGGTTTCAQADKCSLEHAITTADLTRKIVVLEAGTYGTTGSVAITKEVTLLGRGVEIAKGGAGDGAVFGVASGGNLIVYYATIRNGDGSSLGHGISCSGARVEARFVTLRDNPATGIRTNACEVVVDRSTIRTNANGGVYVEGIGQPFTITNNFIYSNGNNSTATFGGVKIDVASIANSRLDFNTIVDNTSLTGSSTYTGGISCIGTAFMPANNIVARNYVGTSATDINSQTTGDCTHLSSLIQNDVTGLAFTDSIAPGFDFRISDASTAKDAATTASPVDIDFFGDERPQHGMKDVGADEYK